MSINNEQSESKNEITIIKSFVLTDDYKKLAKEIKGKLRKTAETIIEIGDLLIKATDNLPKGDKELFYKEIGMSSRSAQRYMQIAKNTLVQELRDNKQLKGKTITDLIKLATNKPKATKSKESNNIDTKKVAKNLYTKYRDDSSKIQSIINELQTLLKEANNH